MDDRLESISCVQAAHQALLQGPVHTVQGPVHTVQVFQRTHEVQTVVQMQLPREQLTMEHVTTNVLVF